MKVKLAMLNACIWLTVRFIRILDRTAEQARGLLNELLNRAEATLYASETLVWRCMLCAKLGTFELMARGRCSHGPGGKHVLQPVTGRETPKG